MSNDSNTKTILITGATDGIGRETVRMLNADGHHLLLHGRTPSKLEAIRDELVSNNKGGNIDTYVADLSSLQEVDTLANEVKENHKTLDVLINNAGVLKTKDSITADGLDIRFMVNTIAPYRLTTHLQSLIGPSGRVVNLSSAAQAPINFAAFVGEKKLEAMDAYAQSKLAITMWTQAMANDANSPIMLAVNPGSLLGSKMVKEGFGTDGGDLAIGANILRRAALSDAFADKSGRYFDNDSGSFANPHHDAQNSEIVNKLMQTMDDTISKLAG